MPALKLDHNEIAKILKEIATLQELKGENPFKVRAYANASRILETLEDDLETLIREKSLGKIKGIGKNLEENITTLAQKGKHPYHQELRAEFPESLFDLFKVPGLGPKKIKVLYEKLDLKSLGELEYACKENRLLKLDGFGAKTQDKILSGIEYVKKNLGRFLYADVLELAEATVKKISKWPEIKRVSLAGSMRRKKEVVKDFDIVCSSPKPKEVMKKFAKMKGVGAIVAQGDTKTSVLLEEGVQCDLRVVSNKEYPYALHHFTGSKEHNTEMRSRAKTMGMKMNEYGLFKDEKLVPCKTEEEIFKKLKLSYIPPELREGMGEIQQSEKDQLPELIEEKDLCGFFHMHSTYSDGKDSLEDMIAAASKMGVQYVGVSEHSQTAFYAHGLKEKDIVKQHKELDQIQKKFPKLKIFKGIESDILPDGSLDYPDKVLKKFDFVIGSVHSHFNMSENEMTKRCLKALENPYCTMLGHPTGRLLLARDGFKINIHKIIDRAAKLGKIVELNSNPHRLDLDWRVLRYAKEKSVPVAINPDAHSIAGIDHLRYGVNIARKAGLTKSDVFNTMPVKKMEKALAETRG